MQLAFPALLAFLLVFAVLGIVSAVKDYLRAKHLDAAAEALAAEKAAEHAAWAERQCNKTLSSQMNIGNRIFNALEAKIKAEGELYEYMDLSRDRDRVYQVHVWPVGTIRIDLLSTGSKIVVLHGDVKKPFYKANETEVLEAIDCMLGLMNKHAVPF